MRVVLLSVIFLVGQALCGVDRDFQASKDVEEFQVPFDDSNASDDDADVTEDIDFDDSNASDDDADVTKDIDFEDSNASDDDADVTEDIDFEDSNASDDDAEMKEELETEHDNAVTSRVVSKILTVKNGGHWGKWGKRAFCPGDSFAVGYDMKIEPKVHIDNTALNAIKLICADEDGTYTGVVTSTESRWGKWRGGMNCSDGRHLSAFDLQVEKPQGHWKDDTAANYVKFKCRCHCGHTEVIVIPPGRGFWGTWGKWSGNCPRGSGICGIQTKVEKYQGKLHDDTALNDVKFFCCELPHKTITSA